jgi:transposase
VSNITLIGVDLAKNVIQICGLNRAGKVVFNHKVTRHKLLPSLLEHPEALIALEACGSSQYWARELIKRGMRVKLIPAQHVKAFVRGNKNDAHDALAIAEASQRPQLHEVGVKSLEQQDIQTLLRIRMRYKNSRTECVNQTRGLLGEYGIVMAKGIQNLDRCIPGILEDATNALTPLARQAIAQLYQDYSTLSQHIIASDKQLAQLANTFPLCRALMQLRGVGPITAMALFASVNNPQQFRNGRQFAAWLGLVPRQFGTGGNVTLGAISKRGSSYLRTLLIHGARTVMRWLDKHDDAFSQWSKQLIARRGKHKAIVAMANKIARHAWIAMTQGIECVAPCHRAA